MLSRTVQILSLPRGAHSAVSKREGLSGVETGEGCKVVWWVSVENLT